MTTDLDAVLDQVQAEQAERAPKLAAVPAGSGLGPDRAMPYIASLQACDLFVDPAYQRELDEARVRRMVTDWDPTMLGVIDVSDRGNGYQNPDNENARYAIINGHHRWATTLRAHPDRILAHLVCNVHRGLTVADEAALFYEIDRTTRRLTGWDRRHARRAAGDQMIAEIEAVCAEFGLRVKPGAVNGYVGCTGALERLHKQGGKDLVHSVLLTLCAVFDRSWSGYVAPLISGTGVILQRYGASLDADRLVDALGKTTPVQLRAQAASLREIQPGSLGHLVAQVLVNRYNATPGMRLPNLNRVQGN